MDSNMAVVGESTCLLAARLIQLWSRSYNEYQTPCFGERKTIWLLKNSGHEKLLLHNANQ